MVKQNKKGGAISLEHNSVLVLKSSFAKMNEFQMKIRNSVLKPYYAHEAAEGRFIFLDKGKIAKMLQQIAVDTIMQIDENGTLSYEEKIVQWPGYKYTHFVLETMSCTVRGHEKQGWMHTARCDILRYCFCQENERELLVYDIPFELLKEWFFKDNLFKRYYSTITNEINRTECKKVPIDDIMMNIKGCQSFLIRINEDERISIRNICLWPCGINFNEIWVNSCQEKGRCF
jgi:hypothetical protein